MSRASLRKVAHATLGAWAAGLRKVLNRPFIRVAIPACSERSHSVARLLNRTRAGSGKAEGVDQRRPVPGRVRHAPQLVRHALGGRQDGVEVILLHQLGTAERQHVRVHVPAGQFRAEVTGAELGLTESGSLPDRPDPAIRPDLQPAQQQPLIEPCPGRVELRLRGKPHWRHDLIDQADQGPAVLLFVLSGGDTVEQPLPLGVLLIPRFLGHQQRSDEVRDLGSGHRVSDNPATCSTADAENPGTGTDDCAMQGTISPRPRAARSFRPAQGPARSRRRCSLTPDGIRHAPIRQTT
jgi:hypothetical protein